MKKNASRQDRFSGIVPGTPVPLTVGFDLSTNQPVVKNLIDDIGGRERPDRR